MPSGFRLTPQQRLELTLVLSLTGNASLQAAIEVAVEECLQRLRDADGFVDALKKAERELARRTAAERRTQRAPDKKGTKA